MPRRSGGDDPDGMRIATVSKLLGVPVPTIRSWERRYDFPAPPRTDGLHRRYGDVVDRICASQTAHPYVTGQALLYSSHRGNVTVRHAPRAAGSSSSDCRATGDPGSRRQHTHRGHRPQRTASPSGEARNARH